MPAYNPPPQVLFSPVTNYYQGKAIRTQQKAAEQSIEFNELKMEAMKDELENAPAQREMERQQAALDYTKAVLGIRKTRLEVSDMELDQYRDTVGPWIQEYGKRRETDGDEAAEEWANSMAGDVLGRLPPEKQAQLVEAAGSDHRFTGSELDRVGLSIMAYEAEKSPDPTSHEQVVSGLVERGFITQEQGNQMLFDIEKKAGTVTGSTEQDLERFGVSGDSTLDREIVKANVAARNLIGLADRTKKQVADIKQAGLGFVGKAVRGIDEFAAEITGLAELMGGTEYVDGKEVPLGSLLNVDLYDWTGPLANASAAVKSNMITLSYLKARSMEPGGRLAKDDVKLARDSLGGDWASKGKINAALDETIWQSLNGLRNYYKAVNQIGEFPEDLYTRLEELEADFSDQSGDIVVNSSDQAAYDALPPGTVFKDETGKQWTKPE